MSGGAAENDTMCDGTCRTPRDRALAELAGAQHGVVSLAQLRGVGLSDSGVRARVRTGRLHCVHRGVYAVGHPRLTRRGLWMAAVLAGGPGAVLSHRSAAALHDLRRSDRRTVDVSAPRGRSRAGLDVHRSLVGDEDRACVDGIPCTSVARTLLDLAEAVDRAGLERAVDRAEQVRLLDVRAIEEVLARANGRRGVGVLRSVLARFDPQRARTRSELEQRFLRLCDRAGVPRPRVNHLVDVAGETVEVDFAWPRRRLAVETDGHAFHGTRRSFEADRRRDQRLRRAGWETLRFTWRQVVEEPVESGAILVAVVNARGAASLH